MIHFSHPTDENPYGILSATIESIDTSIYTLPLSFEVKNCVDGQIKWSISDMYEGHWFKYLEPCNSIATIKDKNNKIVDTWEWDTILHGDLSHKHFLDWCLKNKGSKGIAIGTHDGSTGEWVIPVRDGIIEAFLVEASDKQFEELSKNYSNINNSHLIKSLITKDGLDCTFFESPEGFTNSIDKEHIAKHTDNFVSVSKKSVSLNDLIIQCGLEKDLKWLHLDVEGIDDELIMSLDDKKINLPELIIYESLNLNDERKKKIIKWLENKSYICVQSGWNTIATLIRPDVSLPIHTCDEYEKFWNGMFYTLDSYWDYNYIPVYFANEEKLISDIVIDCKGSEYYPDKRITQILTGKTDKNGFSDRFIKSVESIPSKYLIYLQEDMWLKRSLGNDLLNDLIKFMDNVNADSVRIHSKLWYYDSYELEPTEYIVHGQRMLKSTSGCLLSHNATIWRKDYILKHQRNGEDPWTNENEGSNRMSLDNNNNYHYNIHWYCQPGVSDMGEYSQEHLVYSHIVDEMKSMELKLKLK